MAAPTPHGVLLDAITPKPGSADRQAPTAARRQAAGERLQMATFFLEAVAQLLLFDVLARRGYARVYAYTTSRTIEARRRGVATGDRICRAVEEACVWYYKRVFCLQRSTVVTWMLRRQGVPAQLVIGYRPAPVDSHAWVEVDGAVVNDRPQYQRFYRVLARY